MQMSEDPGKIRTEDYNYNLPDEKIARHPLDERNHSKLLIYRNGILTEDLFRNLPSLLPASSFLVFNNTRVIHARIIFRKSTGSVIEVFCLEPISPPDYQLAFQARGESVWKCMIGNAKKWKTGILEKEIGQPGSKIKLKAEPVGRSENLFSVKFNWDERFTFGEIIELAGVIPIPPYLNRETEEEDGIRYQTVYAKVNGSVAAPTAGLHFTGSVLEDLKSKGIRTGELTLHVGAGTFQPVKSETVAGHVMHNEVVTIPGKIVEEILSNRGKTIAVGTTSLRSLESLYWLGVRLLKDPDAVLPLEVGQWEPYGNEPEIPVSEALQTVLLYLERTGKKVVEFSTRLLIVPGYRFRITAGLITNFHQPQSTLLLLVAAFIGPQWKDAYRYALDNGFRFLSYGDSNLYLP